MDYGHKYADDELKALEKRISKEYAQAEKEVAEKLDSYLSKFAVKDKIKSNQVKKGELTETEYTKWRVGQIAIGKRWEEMRQTLAEDFHNTNNIAKEMVKEHSYEIYALNHNFGTFEVEQGSNIDTSYTLYDRATVERLVRDNPDMLPPPGKKTTERIKAGLDVKWNNQQIQSVMIQSLLQGESIPNIAKRLAEAVGDKDKSAAIRNARTMTTAAENAGRIDSYKRAEDMGIELKQMWVATLDERTRDSHRQLDGEMVKVGETFSNGCRFPGDPLGRPEEVYNCRCTLIAKYQGVQYKYADRGITKEEYEEWKKGKGTESKPVEKKPKEEPKPKLLEFTPAKTKQDAEDFALQFAENVDYSKLSLEKINIINDELYTLTQKYPINKLDEIKPHTTTGRAIMESSGKFINYNKSSLGADLEKSHDRFLSQQQDDRDYIEFLTKRYNGKLPPDVQRQVDILNNKLTFTRWSVYESYEDKLKVVVAHEYGHILADQYFGQLNGDKVNPSYEAKIMKARWDKVYKKAQEDEDLFKMSQYGATDAHEYFAECFAAREFGEKLPDYVEELMQEILDNGIM